MEWKEKRLVMDKELKAKVVPLLRQKGFTGKYPHFRRFNEHTIDVLGFQFSQWGPKFYIEIAVAPISGITLLDGTHFAPEKVQHNHCGKRIRIGKNPFDFENMEFERVTEEALTSLAEGEKWWKENQGYKE